VSKRCLRLYRWVKNVRGWNHEPAKWTEDTGSVMHGLTSRCRRLQPTASCVLFYVILTSLVLTSSAPPPVLGKYDGHCSVVRRYNIGGHLRTGLANDINLVSDSGHRRLRSPYTGTHRAVSATEAFVFPVLPGTIRHCPCDGMTATNSLNDYTKTFCFRI